MRSGQRAVMPLPWRPRLPRLVKPLLALPVTLLMRDSAVKLSGGGAPGRIMVHCIFTAECGMSEQLSCCGVLLTLPRMLRRTVALEAERDGLAARLASAQRQADAQQLQLELAAREWQEKAYAAQEQVRSLTAELQQLQVSYLHVNVAMVWHQFPC